MNTKRNVKSNNHSEGGHYIYKLCACYLIAELHCSTVIESFSLISCSDGLQCNATYLLQARTTLLKNLNHEKCQWTLHYVFSNIEL